MEVGLRRANSMGELAPSYKDQTGRLGTDGAWFVDPFLPSFIRGTTADLPVDWSPGRFWLSSHAKETDRLFATAQQVETFVDKRLRKFQTTLC